jgi:hypothetical protein
MDDQGKIWTPAQAAAIENIDQRMAVVAKIMTLAFEQLNGLAHDTQERLNALGQVLTKKQYVTPAEWMAALQEVQLGDRAEWALNPEIQAGLKEIQQIVRDAGLEPPDLERGP